MLLYYLFAGITILPILGFIIAKQISGSKSLRKIFNLFAIAVALFTGIILLTPISFSGITADAICITVFILLTLTCLFRLIGTTNGMLLKIYISLLVLFLLIVGQTFYSLAGDKKLISYVEIKKVTHDKNSILIHRVLNPNYTFTGRHVITINKTVSWFPICEYRIGKVDLGDFKDTATPSRYLYKVNDTIAVLNVLDRYTGSLDTVIRIR